MSNLTHCSDAASTARWCRCQISPTVLTQILLRVDVNLKSHSQFWRSFNLTFMSMSNLSHISDADSAACWCPCQISPTVLTQLLLRFDVNVKPHPQFLRSFYCALMSRSKLTHSFDAASTGCWCQCQISPTVLTQLLLRVDVNVKSHPQFCRSFDLTFMSMSNRTHNSDAASTACWCQCQILPTFLTQLLLLVDVNGKSHPIFWRSFYCALMSMSNLTHSSDADSTVRWCQCKISPRVLTQLLLRVDVNVKSHPQFCRSFDLTFMSMSNRTHSSDAASTACWCQCQILPTFLTQL
jgi:ribosomal protein L31